MMPSRPMTVGDEPSDQPYARWQVVDDPHGGRFIVLRVDGKDPAGHWVYRVVRDFSRPLEPSAYASTSTDADRLKRYELNYVANRPHVRLSAGDVPRSDVVYLVGSGPSLRKNWMHLLDVTRGVVLGVNQTPGLIPTERMDYFMCIDYSLDGSHWRDRMHGTVGIFDVAATPAVHLGSFKEKRWFVPASRSPFYDKARLAFPHLVMLEHGLNVTFTALSWIVRVLKARTIVLVGMDCSCPESMRHFDEPLVFDAGEEYLVAKDVRGHAVITNRIYLDMAEWHTGVFWFLKDARIRVINATEGGILTNFVEQRCLHDVVPELNGSASRSSGLTAEVAKSAKDGRDKRLEMSSRDR